MLKLATKFVPEAPFFSNAQRAGFEYAEFWLNPQILANWQEVASEAQEHSLRYALHFPNRGDLNRETLIDTARLYQALDCRAMVIHRPMFKRHGAALLSIDPNLRLGVENHRLSRSDFETWATKNQWLTLDVEHLWKFTLEDATLGRLLKSVRELFTRFGDKVIHLHMPGYLPGYEEHRPMYCSRDLVIGVFDILAEFSFDGLVVSETKTAFQNPHELRMDRLLFEHWLLDKSALDHSSEQSGHLAMDAMPSNDTGTGHQPAV